MKGLQTKSNSAVDVPAQGRLASRSQVDAGMPRELYLPMAAPADLEKAAARPARPRLRSRSLPSK